jgi:hypothetical protein
MKTASYMRTDQPLYHYTYLKFGESNDKSPFGEPVKKVHFFDDFIGATGGVITSTDTNMTRFHRLPESVSFLLKSVQLVYLPCQSRYHASPAAAYKSMSGIGVLEVNVGCKVYLTLGPLFNFMAPTIDAQANYKGHVLGVPILIDKERNFGVSIDGLHNTLTPGRLGVVLHGDYITPTA